MTTVSTEEVQQDLMALLDRLKSGESMVIEQDGKAVATLSPVDQRRVPLPASMRIGLLESQGSVPENWKELGREEIEKEFYGGPDSDPSSTSRDPQDASYRLGMLNGQACIPDDWKEIGRQEIEEDFYGKA